METGVVTVDELSVTGCSASYLMLVTMDEWLNADPASTFTICMSNFLECNSSSLWVSASKSSLTSPPSMRVHTPTQLMRYLLLAQLSWSLAEYRSPTPLPCQLTRGQVQSRRCCPMQLKTQWSQHQQFCSQCGQLNLTSNSAAAAAGVAIYTALPSSQAATL